MGSPSGERPGMSGEKSTSRSHRGVPCGAREGSLRLNESSPPSGGWAAPPKKSPEGRPWVCQSRCVGFRVSSWVRGASGVSEVPGGGGVGVVGTFPGGP